MADCKLTPEITEIIVQNIEKGNSYETASQAVGICRKTLYNWIERGEKGEPDFTQFIQQIKKARAKSEMRHVEVIEKAMDKNWQASAWWLERTNKEQWGQRQDIKMEHAGQIDTTIVFKFELENGDNITKKTTPKTEGSNGVTTNL